ncbi:hypothetical protein A3850_003085 [Lewinella sp. 4G2]|nr:hypothetical protein A3850_003085 [Lewinella sp. 4G2]
MGGFLSGVCAKIRFPASLPETLYKVFWALPQVQGKDKGGGIGIDLYWLDCKGSFNNLLNS